MMDGIILGFKKPFEPWLSVSKGKPMHTLKTLKRQDAACKYLNKSDKRKQRAARTREMLSDAALMLLLSALFVPPWVYVLFVVGWR